MKITTMAVAVLVALVATLAPAWGDGDDLGAIKFKRAGGVGMEIAPAVFPHAVHRIAYKCGACHDDLFPMKAGSSKVTMDAIQDGKSCGTCHNGALAFESSFATCPRCHRE
jgi:c(7)-type cytochrome triheme protein